MVELFREYWPVVLIAVVIGIIIGLLVFRPRQRVRLSSDTPVRPHMSHAAEAALEHQPSVTTQVLRGMPESPGDDLERLKGVGPKLAGMLVARGFYRYEQIASLSGPEIEQLDADLGAFRGRLQRDRVVEQARYLARGDTEGFEHQFGKL